MADRNKNANKPKDANKNSKKPQKIFGVMTKRRWFGVVVFLSAMLWSYTAGPPLPKTIVCNRYFMDGTSYDYKTVKFEGDVDLIDNIFKRGFWPDVFTWQIGAYFGFTEGPIWSNKYQKLIFSDMIQNKIFSWSTINGIQIELENAGDCTEKQLDELLVPGSNGLLQHPTNDDMIFIAQHAQARIISYDMNTKKSRVIADKYKGKKFNSPNDMVLGPNQKYIYFTDPPFGLMENFEKLDDKELMDKKSQLKFYGIYRVKINDASSVELLDKTMQRPNGLAFSSDSKQLFVADCHSGVFSINVFDVDKNGKIKLNQQWDESSLLKNADKLPTPVTPLSGGSGCVDGMTVLNEQYLLTTCPGGKLCIIDQKSGDIKALIKLPTGTLLTNVVVGGDENVYVTGNHTVWQLKLQPSENGI